MKRFTCNLLAFLAAMAMPTVGLTQSSGLSSVAIPDGSSSATVRGHVLSMRKASEAVAGDASRIFGGRPAAEGSWPAQVSLHDPVRINESDDGLFQSQFCGGSIIARQWILTAAHCVVGDDGRPTDPNDVVVRTSSVDIEKGDLRSVARVIVHEDYDSFGFDNDIALLQLSAPIQDASGPVGAVNVSTQGMPLPNGPAMVIGWGMMEEEKFPLTLMETDIDIVPNATCDSGMAEQSKRELGGYLLGLAASNGIPQDKLEEAFAILSNSFGEILSENMICAGIPSGARTSCNGDSGGPLMVQQSDGQWLQVGIVSWGREPADASTRCAHENLYSVYTRLSNYYDWIARNVQG